MQWRDLALVAAGGAVGSALRYSVGKLMGPNADTQIPWHTFAVNVSGAFVLGLLITLAARNGWPSWWRPLVAVGVLGGYTTFSTFSLELVELALRGHAAAFAAYGSLSIISGIGGCLAGILLARAL